MRVVRVESAAEMYEAVKNEWTDAHALVMAAAVADYRPVDPSIQKHKKGDGPLAIELERTTDILAELGVDKGSRILVGFAAETEAVLERAKGKLERKGLDFIVANKVAGAEDAMGADASRAWLIDESETEALPVLEKGASRWTHPRPARQNVAKISAPEFFFPTRPPVETMNHSAELAREILGHLRNQKAAGIDLREPGDTP